MSEGCEFCGLAENCPNYKKGYAKAREECQTEYMKWAEKANEQNKIELEKAREEVLNEINLTFYNLTSYLNNALLENFDNDNILNIIEDYKIELIKSLSNQKENSK